MSKRFGAAHALRDVSFNIAEGERVGFVGPNGAGKTTALRILSGYLSADAGRITVAGFDVGTSRRDACANLGYMPDTAPLQTDMRVSEFLRFRARLKGVARGDTGERLAAVISDLELEEVQERLIARLSRGFRQRVALADALIANPRVLLLDEPTTGLDPLQRRSFRELLLQHSADRSVLFSSHHLPEVEAIVERFLVLGAGTLVAAGDLEQLRERADMLSSASSDDIFAKLVAGT
ncbi:MAG: ABC transporter ATP-binding protein [Myxococcales bacterium]|nr:ABC transporter ATP-binding protein [Myxococcales bacterium]